MTERYIAIRRVLLPKDTNYRGEVFGGAILAEMDLAGAVEARKHTSHDIATVALSNVEFRRPVVIGDVVTFFTTCTRIGKTSIHVHVDVESSRDGGPSETFAVADVVYVCVCKGVEGKLTKVNVTADPPRAAVASMWEDRLDQE